MIYQGIQEERGVSYAAVRFVAIMAEVHDEHAHRRSFCGKGDLFARLAIIVPSVAPGLC